MSPHQCLTKEWIYWKNSKFCLIGSKGKYSFNLEKICWLGRPFWLVPLAFRSWPTSGELKLSKIQKNVKQNIQDNISLFSLGIGFDVDYDFLKRLSNENHGIAQRIYGNRDTSSQLKVTSLFSLPEDHPVARNRFPQRQRSLNQICWSHICSYNPSDGLLPSHMFPSLLSDSDMWNKETRTKPNTCLLFETKEPSQASLFCQPPGPTCNCPPHYGGCLLSRGIAWHFF